MPTTPEGKEFEWLAKVAAHLPVEVPLPVAQGQPSADYPPTDDATWERARGWALSQSVSALAYYTPENNPALFHEAEKWLDLVLSERG